MHINGELFSMHGMRGGACVAYDEHHAISCIPPCASHFPLHWGEIFYIIRLEPSRYLNIYLYQDPNEFTPPLPTQAMIQFFFVSWTILRKMVQTM